MPIDKQKDEAMEESTPIEGNGLPESPASANVVCWIDGFRTQFTVRDEKVKVVVERIEFLIDNYAKKKGWKPSWKEEEKKKGKEFVCNECGAEANYKEGISKKTGKPYKGIFCTANRDHIKWLDNLAKK